MRKRTSWIIMSVNASTSDNRSPAMSVSDRITQVGHRAMSETCQNQKKPRRSGAVGVSLPVGAFETLLFQNPLAVLEPPTDHILLSLPFPSAFAPAKDRRGKR